MNALIGVGGSAAAFIACISFFVAKKTNMVDIERERLMRMYSMGTQYESEERYIRRQQAKMLNGGYRAFEVDYKPSNSDV